MRTQRFCCPSSLVSAATSFPSQPDLKDQGSNPLPVRSVTAFGLNKIQSRQRGEFSKFRGPFLWPTRNLHVLHYPLSSTPHIQPRHQTCFQLCYQSVNKNGTEQKWLLDHEGSTSTGVTSLSTASRNNGFHWIRKLFRPQPCDAMSCASGQTQPGVSQISARVLG